MEIRARVARAGRAIAIGIERFVGKFVNAAAQLQKSARGKSGAALRQLRRHDAIEHVHPAMDGFQQIERRAHAHQVTRLVVRQQSGRELADVFAFALALAHREPADRVTVERHLAERRRAFPPQFGKERALHNPEHRLRRISPRRQAPRRPTICNLQRRARRRFVGGRSDAMIQRHHDVAPDRLLRFDAHLRAEQNRFSIQITLERRAFLAHRARMLERENLVAAGVGQDRALPAHKLVDATQAPENLHARPQEQMISIREQNLRTGFLQRARELRFHRRLRSHRHEERRLHFVVQSLERRRARMRTSRLRFQTEI